MSVQGGDRANPADVGARRTVSGLIYKANFLARDLLLPPP
jgi:hypothetical protein